MSEARARALADLRDLTPGSRQLWSVLDASGLMERIERAVRDEARQCRTANPFVIDGRPDHAAFVADLLSDAILHLTNGTLARMAQRHTAADLPALVYTAVRRRCRANLFPRWKDGARLVLDAQRVDSASTSPAPASRESVEALLGEAELAVWFERIRLDPAEAIGLRRRMVEWMHCKLAIEYGLREVGAVAHRFGRTEAALRQRYHRAERTLYLNMAWQIGAQSADEDGALAGITRARQRGPVTSTDAAVLVFWTGASDLLSGDALAELSANMAWSAHQEVDRATLYRTLGVAGRRAIGKAARCASLNLARAHTLLTQEDR